jgi:isocitrate lyase
MASSGRTAATKAMGKGSTQFQHLVQTEVPTKLLEEWLADWSKHNNYAEKIRVRLRPHTAGSELLELSVLSLTSWIVADAASSRFATRTRSLRYARSG